MRNLSTEFKEQQNSGNRNYLKYADFTFTDGSTLSIIDKDLWSNGFKFEDAVSQNGSFDIGAAIINKLTLQINNFSGKYTDYIWDGARVVCYIGLELSTGIEKIRICTMTVTDAPYQSTAIISLTCEDSMRLFDRDYSESKLTYPATRLQIIQDACEVCGVTLQSTRFDNDDFVIQNRPDDSSITFRQVIAWVAQMGCQWAKCDEYGRLCFGWYEREVPDNFYDLVETPWKDVEGNDILDTTGEQIITIMQTGITAIQTNGFTPWLYDLEITGIKVTEYVENSSQNEAKTYQSGKSGYVIEISDNKLIQEGTGEAICKIISDRCVGMKFRPFSTGALTNIAWEAGDTIAISDRNGKQYKSYLTSVTLNPGAFEQLECSAKSASRNKQKQYSLNQQIQAENNKNLRDERTAREKAIEELSQRLSESSGTYTTVETQPDGSNIYYLHNKPQLSDSDIVWKMTAEAWAVSTDGGQHWNGGMTVDGDVIARILTATGVNADWINTGTIKAIDKDGNTTFLVDVTTGRVVINADSVQIKGKDVNAIAKEKAEKEVNNFISNTYTTDINNLQSQIDGKIETWYQPNDPSVKWTKTEELPWCDIDGNKILDESGNEIVLVWESEKVEHEGDLWHNTTDNTQWIYKSGIWQPQSIPNELLDKIDGKSSVYMIQPTPPYYEGDLWVTTNSEGKASLKTSFVNRINGDFTASDWIDFKYADKDDIKNAIDNYDTSLGQDAVFNKLTKGGTEQGIYIEDGKVYINAKYILAGLLAGERINGRGLKVIDDNNKVTLEIDNKGNVILAPKTFSLQGKTVKEIADSSASTAVSGQTQTDIFNKLTKNGTAQGIYLDTRGNIYINGQFIKALSIAANAIAAGAVTAEKLAAKAVTAEKMSVTELAAIGATIGGFTIQNNRIYNEKNGLLQIKVGDEYNSPSVLAMDAQGEFIKYSASGIVSSYANSLNLVLHNTVTEDGFTDGSKHYLGRTQFNSDVNILGDFSVSGTKSIKAETDNYGEQLFYCYETPTPTLGDFGGGVIGKDGMAIISIDDIFQESTETAIEYYVFLQNEGEGQSWVSEKSDTYFVVKGTPGLRFAWELKAKQKNKEYIRFNAGKEDREVNFETVNLENVMFEEREKIIQEMEGELL